MNLTEHLQHLGLNRKQVLVYLALLQLGHATAYAVAAQSGLKRPTVYVLIEELLRRGVVVRVPGAKKHLYAAKDPSLLLRERVEQLQRLEEVLPHLRTLMPAEGRPATLFFEGDSGVKQALAYGLGELAGGELLGFYAHAESYTPEMHALAAWYLRKLHAGNVRVRGLAPRDTTVARYRASDAAQRRTVRAVPREEYDARVSIEVGPRFVRIVSLHDAQAIILESQHIAAACRGIFEMLWRRIESEKPVRGTGSKKKRSR